MASRSDAHHSRQSLCLVAVVHHALADHVRRFGRCWQCRSVPRRFSKAPVATIRNGSVSQSTLSCNGFSLRTKWPKRSLFLRLPRYDLP
eukprot:SAG31_NODE_1035_length_10225_cov_2.372506_1_plen_88_part_10